jgi:hypothetical protein
MTSKEFIFWFNGFVDAVEGIPTQTQWDLLKNKLSEVGEPITWPVGVPNTAPIWQQPYYPNPLDNPFKVTCDNQVILTTTSGSGATYNIPSITTNGNTTWTNLPKGTNINYTANLPKELLKD